MAANFSGKISLRPGGVLGSELFKENFAEARWGAGKFRSGQVGGLASNFSGKIPLRPGVVLGSELFGENFVKARWAVWQRTFRGKFC